MAWRVKLGRPAALNIEAHMVTGVRQGAGPHGTHIRFGNRGDKVRHMHKLHLTSHILLSC